MFAALFTPLRFFCRKCFIEIVSKMRWDISWRRPLSYRNQSIDSLGKPMDWFLYDNGLRYERDNNDSWMNRSTKWIPWIIWSCCSDFFQKSPLRDTVIEIRSKYKSLHFRFWIIKNIFLNNKIHWRVWVNRNHSIYRKKNNCKNF